ncbi:unnamed protein product [Auanema sp. JU1783]|nr:unnamed protein product [Auanema sp. JU1783]
MFQATRTLQQRNSKLDITKVERIEVADDNNRQQQSSFRDVVKTTMLLRTWMMPAHGPGDRRTDLTSEVFEPPAATTEQNNVIEEEVERLSGCQFIKEMIIRAVMRIKYFYIDPNAAFYYYWSCIVAIEEDTTAFGFSYYKVFDPRLPSCDITELGCLMVEVPKTEDLDDERPLYKEKLYEYWKDRSYTYTMGNFSREYSMTMYWSALTITTCGQQPYPSNSGQNMLEVADTMIGVLVFATIIGSVGSVVTEMNQSVYDFRQKMDGIKFYMKYRAVNVNIQERVLNCFMYMNQRNQLTDEAELLEVLPPRLQGQLAVNLHMETIRGVSLFRNCEAGFLYEIVMKIKQQIYNPNDYLCRTGEKAKEMYIVKRGILNVIDDSTRNTIDTLTDGATFGEMSMIRLKGCSYGEYRDCSLRSEGYSDVYILNQDDVAAVLQDYPTARDVIIRNASEWLESQDLLTDSGGDIDETFNILSVDEQLIRLKIQIEQIDDQLNNMCTSFNELSSDMKKRVTNLEITSQNHKRRIKRDIAGYR